MGPVEMQRCHPANFSSQIQCHFEISKLPNNYPVPSAERFDLLYWSSLSFLSVSAELVSVLQCSADADKYFHHLPYLLAKMTSQKEVFQCFISALAYCTYNISSPHPPASLSNWLRAMFESTLSLGSNQTSILTFKWALLSHIALYSLHSIWFAWMVSLLQQSLSSNPPEALVNVHCLCWKREYVID